MSEDKTKAFIAKKLKRLREDYGYSQKDVAEKAGLHTNHYARLERGEFMPKADTLRNLAKVFAIDVAELLPKN